MTEYEFTVSDEDGYFVESSTINVSGGEVSAETLLYHAGFQNYAFYDLYPQVDDIEFDQMEPVENANLELHSDFIAIR